jgi:conjugative relaxase-like TrwC/TraI family protein
MALTSANHYVKSVSHATSYYNNSSTRIADYYKLDNSNDNSMPLSFWHGKGAKQLNLSGEVENTDFAAIASNKTPEGDKLKPINSPKARIGLDFTFTAPKSISVTYALTNDERLLIAFKQAVQVTLEHMERFTKHRLKYDPRGTITSNMLSACFVHRTTRPTVQTGKPDPHLHVHCFIINATYNNQIKEWRALDYKPLKTHAPEFESLFHKELASNIADIGYRIEWKNNKPEIKAINQPLLDKFSNRSIDIKSQHLPSEQERIYSKLSRQTKCNSTFKQLQAYWRNKLSEPEALTLVSAKPCSFHDKRDYEFEKLLVHYLTMSEINEEIRQEHAK